MDAEQIVKGTQIARNVLAEVIDLGGLAVHLEIDRSIPTAEARIETDGGLLIVFNDEYEARVTSDPDHPNRPEATAMHEILHRWFSLDNPAFADHLVWGREPDGSLSPWFLGRESGWVPVTASGHLRLPDLVMSDAPHYRDHEQVLSGVELSMLKDMGVHVWSHAEQVVNEVYHDVLGREADSAGRDYWVGEIESGRQTDETIPEAIAGGASAADAVQLTGVAHAYRVEWGIA